MDPETTPRQGEARLYDRGGDRHHPAPHARLCALHRATVLTDACQFPTRAGGRHLKSVHLTPCSLARREHAADPIRRSARYRLSLSALDDPRLLHVAPEHDRLSRRQDGTRDAAHFHADDLASDGTAQTRSRAVTEGWPCRSS